MLMSCAKQWEQYHYSEARDPERQHMFCLADPASWCKFQANTANGTNMSKDVLHTRGKVIPTLQDLGNVERWPLEIGVCCHFKF